MNTANIEHFSVYGFTIDYPATSHVELDRKSRRSSGTVTFHLTDTDKISVSWGDLQSALKRFQTVDDHAEHSLKIVKKGHGVKNFERISRDSLNVNSHRSAYNRVRFDEVIPRFITGSTTSPREVYSVHVHCPDSSRYFVIYTLTSDTDTERLFSVMANSFQCHS